MAEKEKRDLKDVYIVYVKERTPEGLRLPLETYRFETVSSAILKYEELIMEHSGIHTDKMLLIELQFIAQGVYSTLKEKHLWE